MEHFYTALEVADLLKIKKTTVYDLIKKKILPSSKVGKQIRISQAELDEYLQSASGGSEKTEVETEVKPVAIAEASEHVLRTREYLQHNTGLILGGRSEVIPVFGAYFALEADSLPLVQSSMHFYDCLYALYFGKVHAAILPVLRCFGADVLNCMVPGVSLAKVPIAVQSYGIYVKKGTRFENLTLEQLFQTSFTLMQSEKGSVSRIALDTYLQNQSEMAFQVLERESLSSLAAAAAVDSGQADAATGSNTVLADFPELKFIPLYDADILLAFPESFREQPAFQAMERVAESDLFRRRLMYAGGYQTETLES